MSRLVRSVWPGQPALDRVARRWFAREYAGIAAGNPDLRRLDRRLAGLYLVPTATEGETTR